MNRHFGKCPLCSERIDEKPEVNNCASCYGLDQHLSVDHGLEIEISEDACAWCGIKLTAPLYNYSRHTLWFDHLSQCDAYAAWALSGAQVWKKN